MEELKNTYLLDINAMTEGLVIRLAPSRLLIAFSLETGMRSTSQSIEKQTLVSKSKRKWFKQIIIIPAR